MKTLDVRKRADIVYLFYFLFTLQPTVLGPRRSSALLHMPGQLPPRDIYCPHHVLAQDGSGNGVGGDGMVVGVMMVMVLIEVGRMGLMVMVITLLLEVTVMVVMVPIVMMVVMVMVARVVVFQSLVIATVIMARLHFHIKCSTFLLRCLSLMLL